jgi:3-isopropylmalate dehydrogenase
VHGSAPDIAGQNKANPLALIMSAVMMLRYLAETRGDPKFAQVADRVRDAYDAALLAGERTRDLGGTLGTREFADAIIARLKR